MAISFDFISFTITQDEGDPFWRCSVILANPKDAFSFQPNDEFTINLLGELYHFLVNSISISRTRSGDGPVVTTATVEGVGIGALLDVPRASPITQVWDVDTEAYTIVSNLLEDKLDSWDFINWIIPKNRLAIENDSKISAVKMVVEAAGGVLESFPNGQFYVRRKFPVSPLKYLTHPADIELSEVTDIEGITFNFQNAVYVDWVRIRDIDDSGKSDWCEMEFDKNSNLSGIIHVYPIPWRPVTLTHTGPADLQLALIGEVVRIVPAPDAEEVEELLEIVEGKATTRYPIIELLSIRWHSVDLLGLYFEPYTNTVYSTHLTLQYSLVYITYKTKSIDYRVVSGYTQEVQFLVEDAS